MSSTLYIPDQNSDKNVSLAVCLSLRLSVCLSLSPSLRPSVFVCLSSPLFLYVSVSRSVPISLHLLFPSLFKPQRILSLHLSFFSLSHCCSCSLSLFITFSPSSSTPQRVPKGKIRIFRPVYTLCRSLALSFSLSLSLSLTLALSRVFFLPPSSDNPKPWETHLHLPFLLLHLLHVLTVPVIASGVQLPTLTKKKKHSCPRERISMATAFTRATPPSLRPKQHSPALCVSTGLTWDSSFLGGTRCSLEGEADAVRGASCIKPGVGARVVLCQNISPD